MKRYSIAVMIAVLIAAVAPASAHEKYRIIGKITRVSSSVLDVKQTKDGKVILMFMPATITVTRDKAKRSMKDLKVGLNVVVEAIGDDMDDLEVVTVLIVPAAPKKQ